MESKSRSKTKNISSAESLNDVSYRYKREVITTKHMTQNRTQLSNIISISGSFNRPPDLVVKFLQCELSTQCTHNTKKGADEWYLKGEFIPTIIEPILQDFTDVLVLCDICSNPETNIHTSNHDQIYLKCESCGYKSYPKLSNKISNFIVNSNKSKPKSKKERRKSKKLEIK